METRLGWEAGGGLGAPGGPGGSGGAGAWLKGGPTPEAACCSGLMGETMGETKGARGEQRCGDGPPRPQPHLHPHSQRGPSPAFWFLAASTAFWAAT